METDPTAEPECPFCHLAFRTRLEQEKHINRNHNFKCIECSFEYLTQDALDDHVLDLHRGSSTFLEFISAGQFVCRKCLEKCPTNEDLKQHILTKHSRKIGLKCRGFQCQFEALTVYDLSRHYLREHSETREENEEEEKKEEVEYFGETRSKRRRGNDPKEHSVEEEQKEGQEKEEEYVDETSRRLRRRRTKDTAADEDKKSKKMYTSIVSTRSSNSSELGVLLCSCCMETYPSEVDLISHFEKMEKKQ